MMISCQTLMTMFLPPFTMQTAGQPLLKGNQVSQMSLINFAYLCLTINTMPTITMVISRNPPTEPPTVTNNEAWVTVSAETM